MSFVGKGFGCLVVVARDDGELPVQEVAKFCLRYASFLKKAANDAGRMLSKGLVDDVTQGGPGRSDGEVQQFGNLFVRLPASHARTARVAAFSHGDDGVGDFGP